MDRIIPQPTSTPARPTRTVPVPAPRRPVPAAEYATEPLSADAAAALDRLCRTLGLGMQEAA